MFLDDFLKRSDQQKSGVDTSIDFPVNGPQDNTFSSQLYDAIYAFGAGKTDAAKRKLQTALLNTGEGKSLVDTATRKQLTTYFPFIVLILVGVFFFGALVKR